MCCISNSNVCFISAVDINLAYFIKCRPLYDGIQYDVGNGINGFGQHVLLVVVNINVNNKWLPGT